MIIKNQSEFDSLRKSGQLVADCLQMMLGSIEEGMTTKELDDLGRSFLEEHGAKSAPETMYKFPGATCISLNEEAAHGIPSASRRIKKGDLINIDVSAVLNGFYGDTGASLLFRSDSIELKNLCKSTKKALNSAIKQVKTGARLNLIGKAIEKESRKNGLSIVENLCSHGIGLTLHEFPEQITGYFDPKDTRVMEEGMVFTIEPFLSTGSRAAKETGDGWTLANAKGLFSAQYEHSMVVTKSGAKILTTPTNGLPFSPL